MRPKSWLLTLFYYSSQFALGPLIFVYINNSFDLPVFSGIELKIIGAVLIALGLSMVSYCFYLFKIFGKGTPVPIEPPKSIVFESIYKYSRNPMYIGYVLILFGEFFVSGSFLMIFYATGSIVGFHLLVTLWEEKILIKRFSQEYEEYCRKVPRWF